LVIPGDIILAEDSRKSLGSIHAAPNATVPGTARMRLAAYKYKRYLADHLVSVVERLKTIGSTLEKQCNYQHYASPSPEAERGWIEGFSAALRVILDAPNVVELEVMRKFLGIRAPEHSMAYMRLLGLMYAIRTKRARHGQAVMRLLTLAYLDRSWTSIASLKPQESLTHFFLYWVHHILGEESLTPQLPPPSLQSRTNDPPTGVMTLFIGNGYEQLYQDEASRADAKEVFAEAFQKLCGKGLNTPEFVEELGKSRHADSLPHVFAFVSNVLPKSFASFATPMLCFICGNGQDRPSHLAVCPTLIAKIDPKHHECLTTLSKGLEHPNYGPLHSVGSIALAASALMLARAEYSKCFTTDGFRHPLPLRGTQHAVKIPKEYIDKWIDAELGVEANSYESTRLIMQSRIKNVKIPAGLQAQIVDLPPPNGIDDGLCVFRSCAVLLGYGDNPWAPPLLRNSVASYMHCNPGLVQWGTVDGVRINFMRERYRKADSSIVRYNASLLTMQPPQGGIAEVLITMGVMFGVFFDVLLVEDINGYAVLTSTTYPSAGPAKGFQFAGTLLMQGNHCECITFKKRG
jgi:hypothetical protein